MDGAVSGQAKGWTLLDLRLAGVEIGFWGSEVLRYRLCSLDFVL